MIKLFYPYIPGCAIESVSNVLKTQWVGQGPLVDTFEKEFSEKFNQQYCVAVNSGTSALETAYELVGIKEGDEVIAPVFTCAGANLPLLRMGAKIVWADIDENTMCPSREDILSKITPRTKAIINVHLGGIENDLGKMPVPVISDAAQAIGVFTGDYTCNSFQAIKQITTGDGGMITLSNPEEFRKAKLMRWFGLDREKPMPKDWTSSLSRYIVTEIELPGYKRQMTDISAALGRCGLKAYDDIIAHRKKLFDLYRKLLTVKLIDGERNTYWLCTVILNNRDAVAKALYEAGIESNIVHVRNDTQKIFGEKAVLPNMDKLENRYLCLPLNQQITEENVINICKIVNEYDKA